MSTGAIIAIVVVALIIIALLAFVLPRMRARARVRARERELQQRREQVAGEHRAEAEQREREAAQAEQQARIAQKEAEAQRAQAELHQERAGLHERGMADHELIDEHERDRFEGTSAMRNEGGTLDHEHTATTGTGGAMASGEYQRGRQDEAAAEGRTPRFNRDEETVRDEERTSR
jgi:multidrug efflux pump subunit AcrA (membrane-fusion protein)